MRQKSTDRPRRRRLYFMSALPDLKRARLPLVASLFPARFARGDGGQADLYRLRTDSKTSPPSPI
jgi:hypothetical protein